MLIYLTVLNDPRSDPVHAAFSTMEAAKLENELNRARSEKIFPGQPVEYPKISPGWIAAWTIPNGGASGHIEVLEL